MRRKLSVKPFSQKGFQNNNLTYDILVLHVLVYFIEHIAFFISFVLLLFFEFVFTSFKPFSIVFREFNFRHIVFRF